jgi:glycosyltransferase involved in cell wall biosynthesis
MRIAQVAPLYESVPPRAYGGTERVVSWLTEELVRLGHNVTLFASGDSLTSARLMATCAKSLRADPECHDALAHHILQLENVRQWQNEFDVIHFHSDYLHFPLSRQLGCCQITTLHGRLDIPDLAPIYREFNEMPVVSISMKQRESLPQANWVGNVHHGLPAGSLKFHQDPGKYLAFIGRISPEKRPDRAIEIAVRARLPLKIAAKIDAADREYFASVVRPLLNQPGVEFVGEIGDKEKADFLGNAIASLAPIDWPEPFGLNMIEAMACGTPTIAFAYGSVPEIIEDGVTGIVVKNTEEAVLAVNQVASMSRKACRQAFERRFTVNRMVNEYVAIYEKVVARRCSRAPHVVEDLSSELLSSDLLDKDVA